MQKLQIWSDSKSRLALGLIIGLLTIRIGLVYASPLELYADEAQYWRWSTTLDWGYYSKPPMIAWVIHASTSLFGHSEIGVRLFAPVLHTIAATFLLLLTRRMFGPQTALITTAAYLFMPGIVLSSTVISTDGVLFPFWCAGLYLFWRLREGAMGWIYSLGLGAAIGFGFLSKYAMLYFGLGLALTALIDAPSRAVLLSWTGLKIAGLASFILFPHITWNAANSFQTFGHTVDNANLGSELFNLENLPTFIVDQMGVFGPVSFIGLIAGLIMMRGSRSDDVASKENWLACFIIPVLVIIAFQAVLSRAHANWAATAYPAACLFIASIFTRATNNKQPWLIASGLIALGIQFIPDLTIPTRLALGLGIGGGLLMTGYVLRWRITGLFWSGISLQIALALFFAIITLGPSSWVSAAGMDNSFKRTRGWQDMANQLVAEAERLQPAAILVDEREVWHGLDYYTKDRLDIPLILWRFNPGPKNFAEQVPLTVSTDVPVLIASYRAKTRPHIKADFSTWQAHGKIEVALGRRANGCALNRTLNLYIASGYVPLPRTSEWREQFAGQVIDPPAKCPSGN
ncbi:MAG: hypothetical protein CME93_02745 [Hyphomonadaceae bacterium]|nr:hypothetical protein [Hyphomonadaceae bacterium]OUX94333.1 MAG: hypothetical protein CBB77_04330 [Hyphomonas sp. TMED17]